MVIIRNSNTIISNLKINGDKTSKPIATIDNNELLGFMQISSDDYRPVYAPTPELKNITLVKGKTFLVKKDSSTGKKYLNINNQQIELTDLDQQTEMPKAKLMKLKKVQPKPLKAIIKKTVIPKCIKLYSPDKHIMLQTANTIRVKPSFYGDADSEEEEEQERRNKERRMLEDLKKKSSQDILTLKQDLQELANKNINLEKETLDFKKQNKELKENLKMATSQLYAYKVNEANRKLKKMRSTEVQCTPKMNSKATQTIGEKWMYEEDPLKITNDTLNDMQVDSSRLDIESAQFILEAHSMESITNELLELNKTPPIKGSDVNMGLGVTMPCVQKSANDMTWKIKLITCIKHCDIPDEKGDYPIHNAVISDDYSAVKRQCTVLKLKKIPVDIENTDGHTPLHLAIIHTVNHNIVEQLIAYGAQFSMVDNKGNNCYHLAINYKFLTRLNNIHLLKSSDECINSFNYDGLTPLHLCMYDEKFEEAQILLKLRANINMRDQKSGRTPLFHAVENRAYKIIQLLLESGADRKIESYMGLTPLDIFEKEKLNTKLVKLFSTARATV